MTFYKRSKQTKEVKTEMAYILTWAKKLKAVELLGGCCEICKNANIECLVFHHKDKMTKDIDICAATSYRWSILEKEFNKCQLLCHNCHRELHANVDINKCWNQKRDFNKNLLLFIKGISSCQMCGYNKCISALDFHHNNRDEKEFNISRIVINKTYKTVSDIEQVVLDEMDKCRVLCANCHYSFHHDKDMFNDYYPEILEKKNNIIELSKPYNKQEIYKMYIGGMKQIEIARTLGASKGTISEILKTFDIKREIKQIDDDKFLELYKSGMTKIELQTALKTTKFVINKYHKKYNLPANIRKKPQYTPHPIIASTEKREKRIYDIDDIMKLHNDGLTLREIGYIHNTSYTTIRKIIIAQKQRLNA